MNDLHRPDYDSSTDGEDSLPDGLASVVSASTLLTQIDQRCRSSRRSGGSAFPAAAAWLVLDEVDTHRNQVGFSGLEKLMRAIHERIRAQLDVGDITARFGLDAIGMILDSQAGERDYHAAAAAALRAVSSNLFEVGDDAVAASISLAVRPIRESLKPPEANLVGVARTAEKLTASGGNRSEISSGDGGNGADAPGTLLGQLTKALRDSSLKVVFQPLLSTSGPETERFQLLPRLVGSDGELIPAARFIPVAAARGVLPALDNWMIVHSIQRLTSQVEQGQEPSQFFLNQSPALIDDDKFLEWLRKQVEPLEPEQRRLVLEFNIIELKSRIRKAQEVLARVQELGLQVSLTGIDEKVPDSVMLKHLPCNYLRMKADFARRMLSDEGLARRFQAFAANARKAGRKLIVPMLEDAEAVSRIWQMDVDLIQGNFIQQPSESPEIRPS